MKPLAIVIGLLLVASLVGNVVLYRTNGTLSKKVLAANVTINEYQALKAKDDQLLGLAQDGFQIADSVVTDISNFNLDALGTDHQKLTDLTTKVGQVSDERKALLASIR